MFEILQYKFMQYAIVASILGGVSCGIVGVWVIMLRIPFVGVAMSHAAFAGAVLGLLIGVDPVVMALLLCLTVSALIGPLAEKSRINANISIGILFSLVLGIAFLCLGLIKGPKTEALQLLWGNILLLNKTNIVLLGSTCAVIIVFLLLFFKEIKSVLFQRELARASGVPEKAIFYALLIMTGLSVTFNLHTVGGLLIFSLIINPPSAACQLTYDLKKTFLLSSLFAVLSCLAGLIISYFLNVPTGAVIIITSSLIFLISLVFSPKRRKKAKRM